METRKEFNRKPICFSSVLFESDWLNSEPFKVSSLKINGDTIYDIMLFETDTTNKQTCNSLVSYAWSKKHGLLQYTFQDGTTFTRMNIGN